MAQQRLEQPGLDSGKTGQGNCLGSGAGVEGFGHPVVYPSEIVYRLGFNFFRRQINGE
jgi:hypothetical protein